MSFNIALLHNQRKQCYSPKEIALLMVWTPEQEAEELAKRFSKLKNRADFAREFNVPGGAAMIYQHITGRRPIGLDAAIAYARGFKVSLETISPRLAEEFKEAAINLGPLAPAAMPAPDPKALDFVETPPDIRFSNAEPGNWLEQGRDRAMRESEERRRTARAGVTAEGSVGSIAGAADATGVLAGVSAGGVVAGMAPILAWEHEDDLPPGEYVMVPRLDVHLSAGNGNGHNQVEIEFSQLQPQAFRAEWIRERRLKPNKLAAMTASGDSMEPSIYDGDSLLVDTSQVEVQDGRPYALWYDGGERVKRLFRLPGGGLRIKSDNPQHGTIELGPEYAGSVRIIGRVVHRSGAGGL